MRPLRPPISWKWRRASRPLLRIQCRRFTGQAFIDRSRNWKRDELHVLGIETSCDDTSVALLSLYKYRNNSTAFRSTCLFHKRVTADSAPYGGIHPIVALQSHQHNLNSLVKQAIDCLPQREDDHISENIRNKVRPQPDLIAVTRGPGMRSNLSAGLDLAKGLALAWDVPLIGVHHMQAHALTPRLCSILKPEDQSEGILQPDAGDSAVWDSDDVKPHFPFLTVLASGGHTLLISSKSLIDHAILAETSDIALGDCLDKAARVIVPASDIKYPLGKALEDFAFTGNGKKPITYDYEPPLKRQHDIARRSTQWGWSIGPPLSDSKGGDKSSRRMMYSFAGVLSTVNRLMSGSEGASRGVEERRELARETMRVAFEHLTSRILLYLHDLDAEARNEITTIVISGGVAANGFLRHVLRATLDVRGLEHIVLEFPPLELCTDNALMIAWAGLEMYDAGYESKLDIKALRKWSLDPTAEDGGILGVDGWVKRSIEYESGGQRHDSKQSQGAEHDAVTTSIGALSFALFIYVMWNLDSNVGHKQGSKLKADPQSVEEHHRSQQASSTQRVEWETYSSTERKHAAAWICLILLFLLRLVFG